MPFVRIDLKSTTTIEQRKAIADAAHAGLVDAIGIPPDDRFQIIATHEDALIYDRGYLGINRSDALVMVEIHLSVGRSLEQKRALYAAIADRLGAIGVARQDVFIHLVETTVHNWSFGNGEAQYADRLPQHVATQGRAGQ